MLKYLHVGQSSDVDTVGERRLYRLLEIIPGVLAWATLMLVVILSFWMPFAAATFIILFDVYWLLKAVYVSLHMRSTFQQMRANVARDWLKELKDISLRDQIDKTEFAGADGHAGGATNIAWRDLYHLVIMPMVNEPLAVVRESFISLSKIKYPLDRLIVVLATEGRMGESAQSVAREIEREFSGTFFRMVSTVHPDGIAGEIRGKGSNAAWAVRQVKERVVDPLGILPERVLVSNFDVDTLVPDQFFGCLTWHFLTAPEPLRSSFQPIPIFSNNIWQAPAFARVFAFSTSFWQMIQQARPERLVTFSSQSISLRALVDIGFWQTNVVSEDSRIYWQCFLRYNGDWRTVPLAFPVYMDANVAPTFWQTVKNQYLQIRRWAWGVENNPYFMFGFFKNKKIPFGKKLSIGLFMAESSHSLATNSFIIFLLGWLPAVVGGSEFTGTVLSYNLPRLTRDIMNLAMLGLVSSAILSVVLLPPRPPNYGRFKYVWMVLQWALFPINLIFFGAVPALDAQTRLMLGRRWRLGFWVTPKSRN